MTAHVAAIVAAKDPGHLLDVALRSLLAQTRPLDEIIVVDDASRVPIALSTEFADVRVVRSPQTLGPGGARNLGVAHAEQATHLMVQDADDVSHPERLHLSLLEMDDRALDLLGTQAVLFGGSRGNVYLHPLRPTGSAVLSNSLLDGDMRFVHPSILMKAGLFHAARGYPARWLRGEDFQFLRSALEHGALGNSAMYLYGYRAPLLTPYRRYVRDAEGKHAADGGADVGRARRTRERLRYPAHLALRVASNASLSRAAVRREWKQVLEDLSSVQAT